MANIDITDQGGGGGTPINTGVLQLENGVALDTTLRYVTDQTNTKSQLLLATNSTTVEGTLKVKTDNVEYLDVEDGSGSNRFTISRPALGQKVALDFASNPVGSTTIVGSIRTYKDGVNLGDTMVFREDGNVGIGETTSPSGLLHVDGGAAIPRIILDADTNVARIFSFRTNDTQRWAFRIDDNETGTNAGSNFFIRRYNDAGTFIDAPLSINRANGRVSVNERLLIESDSTVATQTSSVIQSSTTNASLVIAPNGTGALIASIPDGTATGGNARGQYAVDLQTNRSNNSQVASGTYSVVMGRSSTASRESSVAIGTNANATGIYSNAFGYLNTASGTDSFSFGQGSGSTSSGAVSFSSGTSSNSYAFSAQFGLAQANESLAFGSSSFAYLNGQKSFANGNFGGPVKRTSYSFVSAYREADLLSGATMALSLDGTGTTNLLIPSIAQGTSRAWNVTIKYLAVITLITGTATGITVGDTKSQNIEIGFKRQGAAISLVGTGSYSIAQEDASMNTATLTPSAGGSQNLALTFIAPTFAGGGLVRCAVNAKIELTEVSWN